jgi:hypothetical protein
MFLNWIWEVLGCRMKEYIPLSIPRTRHAQRLSQALFDRWAKSAIISIDCIDSWENLRRLCHDLVPDILVFCLSN